MAHHETFTRDDRILRALLLLTRAAEPLSSEGSDPVESELDPEPLTGGIQNANDWDVFVRGRLPRA